MKLTPKGEAMHDLVETLASRLGADFPANVVFLFRWEGEAWDVTDTVKEAWRARNER